MRAARRPGDRERRPRRASRFPTAAAGLAATAPAADARRTQTFAPLLAPTGPTRTAHR